jgi:hypothetical protein
MSGFEIHGSVNTLFENILTYKPHAALRQRLSEEPDEAFSELVQQQRQFYPEVDDLDRQMQQAFSVTLDKLIRSSEFRINKLQEQLSGLVAKTNELRAIRANFITEEDK